MATTNSVSSYSLSNIEDISTDVLGLYEDLMKASVNKNSIYIKAKETMQTFFDSSTLKDDEKAAVLSQMLTGMATSITAQAMSSAIAVAKENRDGAYNLTKIKEETVLIKEQTDKVAADNVLTTAQAAKVDKDADLTTIQGWKIQSDMRRDNGVVLNNLPNITISKLSDTAIADKGIKWETEQQTKMSVYATLAKSYRESGVVAWTVDSGTNKINTITDLAPATPGLTKRQEEVAVRQKVGFNDNMVQHAANSSANMIGLLLSSEESSAITPDDVDRWRAAVDYLKDPTE